MHCSIYFNCKPRNPFSCVSSARDRGSLFYNFFHFRHNHSLLSVIIDSVAKTTCSMTAFLFLAIVLLKSLVAEPAEALVASLSRHHPSISLTILSISTRRAFSFFTISAIWAFSFAMSMTSLVSFAST